MNYQNILIALKRALDKKFPTANYSADLARLLNINPKTASRKLRGETQFTLDEAIKISHTLNISLDNLHIAGTQSLKYAMEIYIPDFTVEEQYKEIIEELLELHILANESNKSKYFVATNGIPDLITLQYKMMSKMYYLNWLYFNRGEKLTKFVFDSTFFLQYRAVYKRYKETVMKMDRSIYVFNANMMRNIIEKVMFFYELEYIDKDTIKILFEEYNSFFDILENICQTGRHPDNGREISIFISDILLPNDIIIVDSEKVQFGIIYAFFLNPIISKSPQAFLSIKERFNSIIRCSELISISGEMNRYEFFDRQRKSLDNMLQVI